MDKIKVVLISDANEIDGKLAEKELCEFFAGEDLSVFNCAELKIEYCIGCFSCRYKTPGKCIYSDAMNEILPAMVNADTIILLSRLEFGCYSSCIKRVLDRTIPFETPFLRTAYGETHLAPRYPKKRKLLTVAYSEEIDAEEAVLFTRLTKRNSLNLDAEWTRPVFLREGEDAGKKIRRVYGESVK